MKARRKPGPKRKRWHECKKCGAPYRNARKKLDHQRKCKEKFITIIEHKEIENYDDFVNLVTSLGKEIDITNVHIDNFLLQVTKVGGVSEGQVISGNGADLSN